MYFIAKFFITDYNYYHLKNVNDYLPVDNMLHIYHYGFQPPKVKKKSINNLKIKKIYTILIFNL